MFWWAILRRERRDHGADALHVFATTIHAGLLGALLTLAPHVLYPAQTVDAPSFGLTALQAQQLAGLFMWIPGGAVYSPRELPCWGFGSVRLGHGDKGRMPHDACRYQGSRLPRHR